jgi:hypothetical protein
VIIGRKLMLYKPKKTSITFSCFSPGVMLATFVFEIASFFYLIWRYKLNVTGRLIASLLFFLGLFQYAEYRVCTGDQLDNYARIGFVAISTLPPVGLHLMHNLAGKKAGKLVYASYAAMAASFTYFLGIEGVFRGYQCTGNYAIFQLHWTASVIYSIYYHSLLLCALGLGYVWINKSGKQKLSQLQRTSVKWLMVGYLVFIVPVAVAITFKSDTRAGIPSIMCGFAVLLAVVLILQIAPLTLKERVSKFRLIK